jgi:hypothetical protein
VAFSSGGKKMTCLEWKFTKRNMLINKSIFPVTERNAFNDLISSCCLLIDESELATVIVTKDGYKCQ